MLCDDVKKKEFGWMWETYLTTFPLAKVMVTVTGRQLAE
jgi:hypothetical protein